MEIWKDIKGFEGLYQVSNEGRVKSLDHIIVCNNGKGIATKLTKGKIKKFTEWTKGYKRVTLSKDGIEKQYSVHRLVAEAFIDNPYNLPCVNHKDENPSNNVWTNLEWCTHKYNMNYGTCQQRKSEKMKGRIFEKHFDFNVEKWNHPYKTKEKKVYQYTLDGKLINVYDSLREASRKSNTPASNISCVCNGKQKTARGYIWGYN